MTPQEAAYFVERFAEQYVEKWERIGGKTARDRDTFKAQGWAILQAAAALRALPQGEKP